MVEKVRTLLLDCTFSRSDSASYAFQGTGSLFDFDLVIWDPRRTLKRYERLPSQRYKGRPSLGDAESTELVEAIARRKSEFEEFLSLGRSMVIIGSPREPVWARTGEKQVTGSGQSEKVTHIVKPVDVLDALPFEYEASIATGMEVEPVVGEVSSLFKPNLDAWTYRCHLTSYPGSAAVKVVGVDKVVGSFCRTKDDGFVAVVPEPWVPEPGMYDELQDFDPDDLEDEAAEVPESYPKDRFEYVNALVEWSRSMIASTAEPLPSWAHDYKLATEIERLSKVSAAEASLSRAIARVEKLKVEQAEDEQWKRLVASDGKALERQVMSALSVLGFKELQADPNRGDLRLDYNGRRVVVEVKGLSKSSGERNAAQLEKWVAAELAEGANETKGLLIVNGWKSTPPADRPPVFPAQMLPYAESRGHCLLTGLQLLSLVRQVSVRSLTKGEAAERLLECVGVFPGFDDASSVLTHVETAPG